MVQSDINKDTGLPHSVSLGDVLADIELAPAQVTAFLHNLAYNHLGGPNDDLGRKLIQHGNDVSSPATYGNDPNAGPDNPQARWNNPTPGAAQGQSTLPPTGGSNEPSWMADARAAGWNAPDDSAKTASSGQPQFTGGPNQPVGPAAENLPADVSPGAEKFESSTPPAPPSATL